MSTAKNPSKFSLENLKNQVLGLFAQRLEEPDPQDFLSNLRKQQGEELLESLRRLIRTGNFIIFNEYLNFVNNKKKLFLNIFANNNDPFIGFLMSNAVLEIEQQIALRKFEIHYQKYIAAQKNLASQPSSEYKFQGRMLYGDHPKNPKVHLKSAPIIRYELLTSDPNEDTDGLTSGSEADSSDDESEKKQQSAYVPQNTNSDDKAPAQTITNSSISTSAQLLTQLTSANIDTPTPSPSVIVEEESQPSDYDKLVKAVLSSDLKAIHEITNSKYTNFAEIKTRINEKNDYGNTLMHLVIMQTDSSKYNLKELKQWHSLFNLFIGLFKPDFTITNEKTSDTLRSDAVTKKGKTVQNCGSMIDIKNSSQDKNLAAENRRHLLLIVDTVAMMSDAPKEIAPDEMFPQKETPEETAAQTTSCSI